MTIDYIVNVVDALVKKTGSRDPFVICEVLDYKLHYIDLHQRLKAYYSACHLDKRAELISKDGFSVVAPIKTILPFST